METNPCSLAAVNYKKKKVWKVLFRKLSFVLQNASGSEIGAFFVPIFHPTEFKMELKNLIEKLNSLMKK